MHTLAITAYHSPRLTDLTQSKFMGSDVKESIPWSVVTGMSAAELAMRGFTGCRDALDLQGRFDPEVIGAGLGDGFKIMGTYFKKYSVCRWAHTSISGLAEIMREQGLAAADLKSVSVDTFGQAAALNNSADPDNIISAQYSLPYTMALAAVYGEDAVSPLTDAMIGMPDAVQLAQRIAINHAPEMDAHLPSRTPARITVETADGRFEKTLITAWGDSGGETGRADYRAKFCMLAGRTLSSAHVDQIIDAFGRIRTGDMQALSRALFSGVSDAVRRAV
jgi:2-methylcitrate dehydratase PrpD